MEAPSPSEQAGCSTMSSAQGGDLSGYHLSVVRNPPGWEIGIYLTGFLVLLGVAGLNIWKLWKSGTFPAPSPFPNFDYRYLQEKYGTSFSEVRQKRVAANNHRRTSTTSSRKASLALGDTPDCFRDLGHLELMSRELDPTGMAQLNRSISTDSLSSISSIANNFGHDFTVGQLEVTLEFETSRQLGQGMAALHITLHQGKDLLEREEGDFPGCFIRVSLGPEELNVGITRVQTNAFTVIFDERFSIPMDLPTLEEYSLRFAAFGIDTDERNISAGVAELKLSDLDLTIRPFSTWLYLQDVNKAVDAVGEILLSLSYLPTAERLTVVVAKCKNLVWTNGKNTADPFVKVYLLQDGRKISKKKTSTKRDDTNPIFNEAMIFSVPSIVLQELSLRVTVAEATEDGRGENLGHVIIGPEASGMGITHWNQMLATLRKPVSMWHPLRRI
ncbi:synaptotagmin-12 isoform X1 [Echeneis naucrates]|uniref:C2 domain-containing protein n=2 Tax=Echeneis naucrates TaxID=173247 RepID=A0A665UHF3_ECHNA|nr:synaptotagmin-12 isoform X1 [Echeneis naucrates]